MTSSNDTRKMASGKKISFVITKKNNAGAQAVAISVANELRTYGWDCDICFLYDGSNTSTLPELSHKVLLPYPPRSIRDYGKIIVGLALHLFKRRPDILHCVLPMANVLACTLGFFTGVRHRTASMHYPAHTQQAVLRSVDQMLGFLGVYTTIIACSEYVSSTVSSYSMSYKSRVAVIPNGVEYREPNSDKDTFRALHQIPIDAFVVGNIGRLAQQKNQRMLIDILRELPNAHVAIAGDGNLRQLLHNYAVECGVRERLHLLGSIERDQIFDFLMSVDAFALPSLYEGLPLSIIEAMACGVPIISNDIPSVRELVMRDKNVAAELVPVSDLDAWTSFLRRLQLGQIKEIDRKEFGIQLAEFYSQRRMVANYNDVFSRLSSPK